jgi:hypothetical protein
MVFLTHFFLSFCQVHVRNRQFVLKQTQANSVCVHSLGWEVNFRMKLEEKL